MFISQCKTIKVRVEPVAFDNHSEWVARLQLEGFGTSSIYFDRAEAVELLLGIARIVNFGIVPPLD